MKENRSFDAIIIGGSYAGLSAAMALGRSLKKVLILDGEKPCNATTPYSHNFLTQDGKPPAAIAALARQQVACYDTALLLTDPAIRAIASSSHFTIETLSGAVFEGRKLIFATGIKDLLPDIKGLADCWGKSVIHCPYCHGYEYRNRKTGILANGSAALHLAKLVHNLTKDLTLLTNGEPEFTDEEWHQLQTHHIAVRQTGIREVAHTGGQIHRVIFNDYSTLLLDALYARVPFVQHSNLPATLGCALTEQGYIQVDAFQKTTVPGVFACGDAVSPMRSVASAVAGGNLAGAMVNNDLSQENFMIPA
ncbi:NAD(P)/FAD-dependent oxidoreductase [Niabella aurantiaca]|uniref:NAD(P)/FAD-dependent oxidoreductase n=1 Tax=Niabella aurantiaca TaxID=379900 RepID=UPI00036BDAF9|nr:NAD(P)/FAD-dependent oxidoreductase [Niabella aurantiaca]